MTKSSGIILVTGVSYLTSGYLTLSLTTCATAAAVRDLESDPTGMMESAGKGVEDSAEAWPNANESISSSWISAMASPTT